MTKTMVEYSGGQSRTGTHAVDYMLAEIDGVELYAELPPIDGEETGTYEALKAEIVAQAKAQGIDPGRLGFVYDGAPQSTIGRKWDADTQAFDWDGCWPLVDDSGIIIDVILGSESPTDAPDRETQGHSGVIFDDEADCYRQPYLWGDECVEVDATPGLGEYPVADGAEIESWSDVLDNTVIEAARLLPAPEDALLWTSLWMLISPTGGHRWYYVR